MSHTTSPRDAFLVWKNSLGGLEYHPSKTYERVGDHETDAKFTRLADLFWPADSELRAEMRAFFDDEVYQLMSLDQYTRRAAVLLRTTRDGIWLRRALAIVAIENVRWDSRDTTNSLILLRYAAEQVGIDPGPEFVATAALCDTNAKQHLINASSMRPGSLIRDTVRWVGPADWREEIERLGEAQD